MNSTKQIAVYLRVSTRRQDTASQEPDIDRWIKGQPEGTPIRMFRDNLVVTAPAKVHEAIGGTWD